MDQDTAKAVQLLANMIDSVSEVRTINGLSRSLSIILACSARRNGTLSPLEIDLIETTILDTESQVNAELYQNPKDLIAAIRQMWDRSAITVD